MAPGHRACDERVSGCDERTAKAARSVVKLRPVKGLHPNPVMRSTVCLAALAAFALIADDSTAAERMAAVSPVALLAVPDRLSPLDAAHPGQDAAQRRSCSASSPRQAAATCVSLTAAQEAQEPSPAGHNLGMAYTQRFLPGFAVTVDRAPSMLTGFMAGLGRSIAQGRNCFAGACTLGPSTMLDAGGTLLADAVQAAPLRRPVADPGELAGVSVGYGWDIAAGSMPLTIHASAAQLFDAPADTVDGELDDGPRPATTGNSLGLALRRGALELGVAQKRLRLRDAASFSGTGDGSRITQQELRLAWQLPSVRLSLVLAEAEAPEERGLPQASSRSTGLQFEFRLR